MLSNNNIDNAFIQPSAKRLSDSKKTLNNKRTINRKPPALTLKKF